MPHLSVVIPCYHLVWYNIPFISQSFTIVVIPCYHLVWYNLFKVSLEIPAVVIPCYHLVWYNQGAQIPTNYRDSWGFHLKKIFNLEVKFYRKSSFFKKHPLILSIQGYPQMFLFPT